MMRRLALAVVLPATFGMLTLTSCLPDAGVASLQDAGAARMSGSGGAGGARAGSGGSAAAIGSGGQVGPGGQVGAGGQTGGGGQTGTGGIQNAGGTQGTGGAAGRGGSGIAGTAGRGAGGTATGGIQGSGGIVGTGGMPGTGGVASTTCTLAASPNAGGRIVHELQLRTGHRAGPGGRRISDGLRLLWHRNQRVRFRHGAKHRHPELLRGHPRPNAGELQFVRFLRCLRPNHQWRKIGGRHRHRRVPSEFKSGVQQQSHRPPRSQYRRVQRAGFSRRQPDRNHLAICPLSGHGKREGSHQDRKSERDLHRERNRPDQIGHAGGASSGAAVVRRVALRRQYSLGRDSHAGRCGEPHHHGPGRQLDAQNQTPADSPAGNPVNPTQVEGHDSGTECRENENHPRTAKSQRRWASTGAAAQPGTLARIRKSECFAKRIPNARSRTGASWPGPSKICVERQPSLSDRDDANSP